MSSNSSKISGSIISGSSFASSAPPPAAPPPAAPPNANSIPPAPPDPTALKAELPPLAFLSPIKATGPVEEKLPSLSLLSASTIFPEVDSALCLEGPASLKKEGDAPATAGPTFGDIPSSSRSKLFPFPFVLLLAEGPGGGN